MCAIHRAGGNAPMNQAHSTDGFADDNGGWGYYEEEEYEEEEEEDPEHHNQRALQQQQRAELYAETGQLPELAVTEHGAPLQQELLQQVPERQRPHQPEPTGTAKLAASSQSATYKRTYVRHIDRSRQAQPERELQMRPERHVPQPTDPDDMPSILTPPPSNPARQAAPVEAAPEPPPSSPWSLGPPAEEGVDEHGQPLAQDMPASPFDVEYKRDPYNALKKLKPPKDPQYAAREPLWPDRQAPDPSAAPHPVRPVTPPEREAPPPAPPVARRPKPAVRYLSASPPSHSASSPSAHQPPPAPAIDDLDETIGGANSFLLVDDDFFDRMAGQAPPPPPPSPARSKRHAPKLALEDALGVEELEAIIANEEIMDIGLIGHEVDGDTMFAGNADALLQEAAAELANGGWADEDPFQAAMLSLGDMPLNAQGHTELADDNLDSTMTGSIEDFPGLSFEDDDWDK